ncbi:TIGR03016 family PEP-CTERM system-associated outer membrane protein [Pseudodesulfovibrio thermohalotolerans]|uniref:TIGR03016 family PEP-CTERM system-associated outer membrane protein n=1 Tax=Pseudodesulfovibrio thermohalotolerans TaxID=2880651 RepID=UPI0024431095|nr:TIGR03016 family PEP-CTERM system-associated outer membrane protein [Pseudodesulfovibrio thermohalotolerans]WFS61604.1 TIGR03016 family PEP-CTERM system-associated outer membrane protein [Pseudodesulfovibrio thermohalotolerans]
MTSFLPKMLAAVLLAACLCPAASAAGLTFQPRVTVTGEYNDNVEEVDGGAGDWVAIVKPGLSLLYEHSRVLLDVSYDFEHKRYANQVLSDEYNNYLTSSLAVEAIKDLFYVDISDNYQMVYQNVERGEVPEGDTSNGTTDQNIFSFKPYFSFPLQERTTLTTGAQFKDIWYSEEDNVDKRVYSLFADVNHELTERFSMTLGVGYDKQDPRFEEGGFNRYSTTLGAMYSYAEGSFVEASISPTYTDYVLTRATDKQYVPYSLSITHAFSNRLTGIVYTEMDFAEDPTSSVTKNEFRHGVEIDREYARGHFAVALEYRDYESENRTSRTTYWRPSIKGGHQLTERLGFNYNVYMDLDTNPDSDKYLFALTSLRYELSEQFSCSLNYRFKDNDAERSEDDYISNTVGLSVSWVY